MTDRKSKAADPVPAPAGAGLGRVAYEAYLTGHKRPTEGAWVALVRDENEEAAAWCAAAQAVITATIERTPGHARS